MAINICDIFIDLENDSIKDLREILISRIIKEGFSYFLM